MTQESTYAALRSPDFVDITAREESEVDILEK